MSSTVGVRGKGCKYFGVRGKEKAETREEGKTVSEGGGKQFK